MLTLENFEAQIDPTILERGKQYFKQGYVVYLEEDEEDGWEAEVEGTETYQIELVVEEQSTVTDYTCDCPYDGEICKHVVAVLYALRDEFKKPVQVKQKRKVAKNVFDNLLQTLTLKEYQDFVRHFAAKNKDFKTEFELFFAEKDERIDVGKKYGDLIKKLIRKHSDHGFVDYRSSHRLSKDVEQLLANGHDFLKKQNYRDAFTLGAVLLKEMMTLVESSDDSSGNISGTISDTIALLEEVAIAEQAAPGLKEEVFAYLKVELSDKSYFNYGDYGYELFPIFQNLAVKLNKADIFIAFLDNKISSLTGKYDSYNREYFQKRKISFLTAIGKTEAAAELVQQSLDIIELRQGEVDKAIAAKNYEKAKGLIADGIKIAQEKEQPGYVWQWQKELLRIAHLEKDTATIRHYTRKFSFDRGFSEEYYKQWKATYPVQEWKELIDKLIGENIRLITKKWQGMAKSFFKPPHPPLLSVLAPIYIQEQYWDKLLELVKQENKLDTTLNYHQYLASRYPSELLEMYLPAFAAAGAKADNRSAYADLARKMKKVMQDMPEGQEKIKEVARSLIKQFPRRPAMIDELNKILK